MYVSNRAGRTRGGMGAGSRRSAKWEIKKRLSRIRLHECAFVVRAPPHLPISPAPCMLFHLGVLDKISRRRQNSVHIRPRFSEAPRLLFSALQTWARRGGALVPLLASRSWKIFPVVLQPTVTYMNGRNQPRDRWLLEGNNGE